VDEKPVSGFLADSHSLFTVVQRIYDVYKKFNTINIQPHFANINLHRIF